MIHVFTPAEFDGINSNLTIEIIDDCFLYVSYKNYKKIFEIATECHRSNYAGLYWPDGAENLFLYLKKENKNESPDFNPLAYLLLLAIVNA